MPQRRLAASISPLTHNRLCLYLRSLRRLDEDGHRWVSSQELADRFHLSAAQIRKDLTQLGAFGTRGVGYEIAELVERLTRLLRLDRVHRIVVVGMGNLGRALSSYLGFNHGAFHVVAGVDADPEKIGKAVPAGFVVRPTSELTEVVVAERIDLGVLTVPPEVAQENYDLLVAAGVRGVLNFAPARIRPVPQVPLKDVDLRIYLEELAFYLPSAGDEQSS